MKRTDNTLTDGGATSDFETVSKTKLGRSERFRQTLDERLLAPLRIVWDDWRARVASFIILGYLVMGLVAWVSASKFWILKDITLILQPHPNQGPLLVGPFQTLAHPLGTTYLGTDILSLIVYATPPMLKMVFAGAVFTVVVATIIGTFAGYKGGVIDRVLMTITDVMLTIPGLPLIIVLAGVLELSGNPFVIGILLSVNAWAGLARSLRSQVLTLRDAEYVEASRLMDIPTREILGRDIVPNLMPYITMSFVQQARNVIFASVALYFLGILPFTTANWGVIMQAAYERAGAVSSPQAFHWLLAPMLAIVILALGLTLFAQAADRLFNPRVRARHAKTVSEGGEEGPKNEQPRTTGGMP